MKKNKKYFILILWGLVCFLGFYNNVFAAQSGEFNFCDPNTNNGVIMASSIIGYMIFAAKIAVPIILIVLGTFDFVKAVVGDKDAIQKSFNIFVKRIIAAICVYLVPTVFLNLFNLILADSNKPALDSNNNTACIVKCIADPNNSECKFKRYGDKSYGEQ